MDQNHRNAIWALNKSSDQNSLPPSQYKPGQQVWLDATHLRLPHQKAKLTPRCLGLFKIIKEISPVAYRLALPANWRIHDVFHASLLNPYHETNAHGPNFTRPPPDLIEGEEEYEVERIIAHQVFGRSKCLQYLIKWKGYPESDNSWEPADQVHAPDLVKHYHSAAKDQSAVHSAVKDQSDTQIIPYQSTREEQSATRTKELKGERSALRKRIECLMIFPASLSNAFQRTSLSTSSLPSNAPSMTLIPLNCVLTAFSDSGTSSVPRTLLNTVGTASSTIAPFTIATEACPPAPSMPPMNPPPIAHPLPGSLVLVATSPFQSRNYSASPSPSPITKTTLPLAFPDSLVQATLPIPEPRMCQSSLTSHWGDCHPNRSATLSQPPTWTHLHSTPLLTPLSKLRTAAISNISARSGPRTKNTRQRSTSWRKISSSPSPGSSITKRPLSRPQTGTSLTIRSPRSPSPSEKGPTSLPNGSSSLMTGASRGI